MRISEAAEQTGLSISNIRFYEKKGLLEPARIQQSKYRDYTAGDILRLKQIVLYRKMDIPIETIQLLLNGEAELEQALSRQMTLLKEKQAMLQGAMDLCQAVMENPSLEQQEIEYYLNYVKTEEAKGRKFAEIEEVLTEFAAYTKFDMLAADPFVRVFLRSPKAVRTARIIWVLAVVMLPVIAIYDVYKDGQGIPLIWLLYWGLILVSVVRAFLQFRRQYR